MERSSQTWWTSGSFFLPQQTEIQNWFGLAGAGDKSSREPFQNGLDNLCPGMVASFTRLSGNIWGMVFNMVSVVQIYVVLVWWRTCYSLWKFLRVFFQKLITKFIVPLKAHDTTSIQWKQVPASHVGNLRFPYHCKIWATFSSTKMP